MDHKTQINRRVQERFDALMKEGAHGIYETVFRIVHEERADASHDLLLCAEATLLFHSGGMWSEKTSARWKELTGTDNATNKMLCDMHRAAIAKARGDV